MGGYYVYRIMFLDSIPAFAAEIEKQARKFSVSISDMKPGNRTRDAQSSNQDYKALNHVVRVHIFKCTRIW
jgi:hypothetical protein